MEMNTDCNLIEVHKEDTEQTGNIGSIFRGLTHAFSNAIIMRNDINCEESNIKEEILFSTKLKIIKNKDFVNEFRSQRDTELFVSDYSVILDCKQTNLESIISQQFEVLKAKQSLDKSLIDIKQCIFAVKNQILSKTIQGIYLSSNEQLQYDQSWLSTHCSHPSIKRRHICIARLTNPTNLGITSHNLKFFILVLTPTQEKSTKSAEEVCHTFATLFADLYFRLDLINAKTEEEFIDSIAKRAQRLANKTILTNNNEFQQQISESKHKTFGLSFCKGVTENFKRRKNFYLSDFIDGFVGPKTIHKTIATTVSLYFAIILPCIAFGVRDHNNTNGFIDTRRALIGQTIGGLIFALFSGQPLVVIMTTAPLCLYTKVVYDISTDLRVNFYDMFAMTGLWNAFFVIIYALFDVSYLMKWCTRSTEEIFGLFSFFAFLIEPIRDCILNFQKYYCVNTSANCGECAQQNSVLFLMLMIMTVWLALILYDFNKTPYLNQNKREILSDYALPIAVLTFSFVGTYLFREIKAEKFEISSEYDFKVISFKTLTVQSVFVSMALGFALSLLFFMDQNISAALVNNPNNKLKKGGAYHWDLLVVALLNIFLSIFGLPWMNGMLPHSPIHARSLADIQQSVDSAGNVREEVLRVRETRVTGLMTHVLIGVSLLLIPHPLDYIPVSVLNGLFLYCAIASLRGNSFVERILLLITEQASYPPNHYIRRCPQRLIHAFTAIQLIQSAVLCFFAFSVWPYVQMAYPVIIAILIPIRSKLIPLLINVQYVEAIDGYH